MSVNEEVHIAPGTAAAGCMKQALHPSATMLVNQDYLSHGPLPRLHSLEQWHRIREEYVRSLHPDWPEFSFTSDTDLLSNAASLRDGGRIVLWVGTGLAEQLLLAWTVQLLRLLEIEPSRLQVIQFVRDSKRGLAVHGLGILNPDALRAHPPSVPLTEENIQEIDTAWNAVTASDPRELIELLADDSAGSLPHLRRSLKGLLNRFPDLKTGLSHWESELLSHTRDQGPLVARVIGFTMGDNMGSPDWVGDEYLFSRMRRLGDSRLAHPLLSLSGPVSIRGSQATLTEAGAEVLAGGANAVDLNGIDDWIGGVHLKSGQGRLWFRSDRALVVKPEEPAQ